MGIIIRGTNGSDEIYQDGDAEVSIYGYGGNDDIYLNLVDEFGGNNDVDAGTGNDYVLNYFEGGNVIDLGAGNDLYVADIVASDSGNYDEVSGGDGNDRFEVDTEASEYYGDSGNDTFLTVGVENYFDGGAGNDTISYALQDKYDSQRGKGVTVDLGREFASTTKGFSEELKNIENATGTNFGDDDLFGSSTGNVLKGLAGEDIIDGLGGDDDLYGGDDNDDLDGGTGDDILVGGFGVDYLTGGKGTDTFDFNFVSESGVGSKRDVITDFHRSEADVIDLRSIDANELRGGNQAFTFMGAKAFDGKAGEVRFSNGVLSGDTDGDRVADFQIKVSGVTKMFADDFFL